MTLPEVPTPPKFTITDPTDEIQRHHAYGHFYEEEELTYIAKFLKERFPDIKPVIIDVGANIGNHTLFFDKYCNPETVYVFEPNPTAANILYQNMELNGCSSVNTEYITFGLGDHLTTAVIAKVEPGNLGTAELHETPDGNIFVTKGDNIFQDIRVDFIKIDVEKMELQVLAGLEQTIAANRPIIYIEVDNNNYSAFSEWCRTHSYTINYNKNRYINNETWLIVPTPVVDREYLKSFDRVTYLELFDGDTYLVKDEEIRGKTVVDIGACLGFFSLRCVELGARRIMAVEAQPLTYHAGLLPTTAAYPMIYPIHAAMSDVDGKTVYIPNHHVCSAVTTNSAAGEPVQTMTLKTLIKDLPPKEDLVLKIDCEGSEFNVFMTADKETVRRFNLIYIELHNETNEDPNYRDVRTVRQQLKSFGFDQVHQASTIPFDQPDGVSHTEEKRVSTEKWIRNDRQVKYSIVIPTYNHCDDLLKPCLESIMAFTDLSNVEVLVVANGCVDNTRDYVNSLGSPFKLIWMEDAAGYTTPTNVGINSSIGEYVILMNNDIILLQQPKNQWLQILEQPFLSDAKTGITGPVKFSWDCGGTERTAMAFWLVMMKNKLFSEIGILDEIFSPGMGEDGDFSIRAVQAGYKLTSVPEDVTGEFEVGIKNFAFPIWHKGNGTFADDINIKDEVIQRNIKILNERYGKQIEVSIIIPTYNHFHDAFKICIDNVLKYTDLSNKEVIVSANGCTDETRAYMDSLSDKIRYVWSDAPTGVVRAYNSAIVEAKGKYIVLLDNDSFLQPQEVDSWINILKAPFLSNPKCGGSSPFANHYVDIGLLLHSGCTMYRADVLRQVGMFDEVYNPGYFSDPDVAAKIWEAGYECIEVPESSPGKVYANGVFAINFPVVHMGDVQTMNKHQDVAILERNRAVLYARHGKTKMKKYSIVIPTYNHCDDLLRPCLESIVKYTDLSNVEVIVVANGCTDGTKDYVESMAKQGHPFKLVWLDAPSGYTKSTNEGIKVATGEFVVLLNNDTLLLEQQQNKWLDMMVERFADPTVGMVGPLGLHDDYADADVLIFFCVMIRKALFDKIGLLDEIFSPGGGEDIDFTVRANNAGYKSISIASEFTGQTNTGNVPIWHKDNKTFVEMPEYTNYIIKRNGLINCLRYNKNIKLNLGSAGEHHHGYLSLDAYDKRAHILMDAQRLEVTDKDVGLLRFADNSVSEILASHLFEHFNPYYVQDNLREWLRVLKPGGKLIMELPNIEELCKRFGPATKGERYGILGAVYGTANTMDDGKNGTSTMLAPHMYGWWPEVLTQYLQQVGYGNVVTGPQQIYHPESNFRIEGTKMAPTTEPVKFEYNVTHKYQPPLAESTPQRVAEVLASHPIIKLNLGSGGIVIQDFLSVDLYDERADIHMDITKLTFPENSVDEIVASHVFEHISPFDVEGTLKNWFYVLKPGGRLIMEMPNIEELCARFATADWSRRWGILSAIYGAVNSTSIGGPDNITSPHLYGWWPEAVYDNLGHVGYRDITFGPEQMPHPESNMRVECKKPGTLTIAPKKPTPTVDRNYLKSTEPNLYNEIFELDSYQVTEAEVRGKYVVDIGANLGFFSLRCVELGAKKVIAVEAQKIIYDLGLVPYTKDFPNIATLFRAVTNVDGKTVWLKNLHIGSQVNNDGQGDPVETVTLKTLIAASPDNDMILKMDCEGSEYDIILGSDMDTLRRFAVIHVEMHSGFGDNPAYNDNDILRRRLNDYGFDQVGTNRSPWLAANGLTNEVCLEKWVRR